MQKDDSHVACKKLKNKAHANYQQLIRSEISGSQGSEYEDGCLLDCCAMYSDRSLPTFQRCLLPPSSGHAVNQKTKHGDHMNFL
jgi:hypothetical protein